MYTSHGHQIPGTKSEGSPGKVHRCGGVKICKQCKTESAFYWAVKKKDSNMVFETFVRKPFTVEAVQVTEENMEDLAKLIGEIAENEKGERYIAVDSEIVPNVFNVWEGYWVTRMGDNIRCYSRGVFREQFIPTTPELNEFIRTVNRKPRRQRQPSKSEEVRSGTST